MAAIRENRPDLTVPHVCLRVHFIEHGLPIPMGRFEGGHGAGRLEDFAPRFSDLFPQPPGDADKLPVAGCMEISPAIWQLVGTPMGSDVNRHLLVQGGMVETPLLLD